MPRRDLGGPVSELDDELAREKERLREAQEQLTNASGDQRAVREAVVRCLEGAIIDLRGELLPKECQEALNVLVGRASDAWLAEHPGSGDPARRRQFVEDNIRSQLVEVLFHPRLDLADHAEGLADALEEAVSRREGHPDHP